MADPLSRVTVNLTCRGRAALNDAMGRTGENQTDAINRAAAVYDWATARHADQAQILARHPDGTEERVVFL